VLTEQQMPQADPVGLGFGSAMVYSARCPGAEGINEDAAALIPVDDERGVLVVADGVGGRPGGHNAADITVRCLREAITPTDIEEKGSLRTVILDAVEEANRQIMDLRTGAATTLALVEIDGRTLRPYHVGDSAILVVGQRGKIKLQTIAHSPVGYAVESGMLDEADAMHHEERHLVSNMVGDTEMRIEVGSRLTLARRDTVLLATDGVFDNLSPTEIVKLIRSGPIAPAADALARACMRRMESPREGQPSKPDDVTFIVYRPGVENAASG